MRIRALSTLVAGLAGALVLAGCGGGGGGGCDDPVGLTGNWSGTLQDNNCGAGTFGVTFAQTHCSVTGVWSADFAIPACDELGSLQGTVDETSVDLRLSPNGGGCTFDVTGVLAGVDGISGTYAPRGDCQVQGGGSFSLARNVSSTATPGPTSTPAPTPTP